MTHLANRSTPLLPTLLAAAALAVGACATELTTVAIGDNQLSFEEFEASLPILPPTGDYLVEGDIRIHSRDELHAYYLDNVHSGALTVDQSNSVDVTWNGSDKHNLTYCVSTAHFTASSGTYRHSNVVSAVANAIESWESVADVDFHYVSSEDGSCDNTNNNVMFDVRSFSEAMSGGSITTASAFFPDESRSNRTLWINDQANYSNLVGSFNGTLRHEVGHILGFRHEHIRVSSCTNEGSNYREVTEYNQNSIMHYTSTSCGGDGDSNDTLTSKDEAGAASVYGPAGGVTMIAGGTGWGASAYVTSIAFGDVDGDGRDEVGVTRNHNGNDRYFIYDDALANFAELHSGGSGWGSSAYATAIAFGDVDGDGRDEVAIGRDHSSNDRFWILDDSVAGFGTLLSGGSGWGSSAHVTSLAFGDVDGDGRDELGVTRYHDSGDRYFVYDDANANFSELLSSGDAWGSSAYATTIAFGDIDGDGRDEVAVGRDHSSGTRYWVLNDKQAGFSTMLSGGNGWGSGAATTSMAFGDIDNDGRDELAVAREHSSGTRYWVLDDSQAGFSTILSDGGGWGSSAYASAVAFGDIDADGIDEFAVAREHHDNMRYTVYDDSATDYQRLMLGGYDFSGGVRALAFGNVDGDTEAELGVGGDGSSDARFIVTNHDDTCRSGDVGGWSYCSTSCPCVAYQGDCDNDNQCADGTACTDDIGDQFGMASTLDVCM